MRRMVLLQLQEEIRRVSKPGLLFCSNKRCVFGVTQILVHGM